MTALAAVVAATASLAAGASTVPPAEATLADCDAPSFATTLVPASPDAPRDARAVWLDARHLRWPGAPAAARYRLVSATTAGLSARTGAPVGGASGARVLAPVADDAVAGDVRERYRWVGDGPTFDLGDAPFFLTDAARGEFFVVAEDASGRVLAATGTQIAGAFEGALTARDVVADDLGVTASATSTAFALWAPTARAVSVCVYDAGTDRAVALWPMATSPDGGIWRVARDGDRRGGWYRYLVDVHARGTGFVRNRVTDPYAIGLDADSQRSWIGALDDPATKPDGWDAPAPKARPVANTDLAIYELHVRDFSIGDATVPAAMRGRFAAFTQAQSDGMAQLASLRAAGITDVHLLPVFDFATVPERGCVTPAPSGAPDAATQQATVARTHAEDCFNWGYDPLHYTVPEGSYAMQPDDGAARIREFRAMVQALHRIGLRVGMDVVYNHTSASGQSARAVLDRIVPGYYQRLDARGEVATSTCCANTATEHAMMAKLMRDSVVTWARDYRIDSFRFDLMGHQPRDAMTALATALRAATGREVPLIGEGWNFGEIADGARFVQAAQGELDGTGIGTFSDRARDAVRGGGPADDDARLAIRNGWISSDAGDAERARLADLVRVGLAGTLRDYEMTNAAGARVPLSAIDYAGQPAGYASAPGEVVNYVENHDGLTLYDVNALKLPVDTPMADRARAQIVALSVVAFSQGVAYFHAGGELLRSKSLDRNSYDSGDWFNAIDWRAEQHTFGRGLPPQPDNGKAWDVMRPLLADPGLVATPEAMRWTRGAFADLLRIRASSALFRLSTAAAIRERLAFFNVGTGQQPGVVAARIDGAGLADATFDAVVYVINADPVERTVVDTAARGARYALHPVHRASGATDTRIRDAARFDRKTGAFTVPARSAVVFVVPRR